MGDGMEWSPPLYMYHTHTLSNYLVPGSVSESALCMIIIYYSTADR